LHLEHFFDGIEHLAIVNPVLTDTSRQAPVQEAPIVTLVYLHFKEEKTLCFDRTLRWLRYPPPPLRGNSSLTMPPSLFKDTQRRTLRHEYLVSQRLYWCLSLYPHWQEPIIYERSMIPAPTRIIQRLTLLALDSSSSVFFSILKELPRAYVDFIRTKSSPLILFLLNPHSKYLLSTRL
jgi:hypothetical protein